MGQSNYLGAKNPLRRYHPIMVRDRVPLGPGSTWIGSWYPVSGFEVKTVQVTAKGSVGGGGGSFAIIAGMLGTGVRGATGTYYGPIRLFAGTFTTQSFTEAVKHVRIFVQHTGLRRGTVTVTLGRQT